MQIRITDASGETSELIAFAEPDVHGDEYKYTDVDGDQLAIFTALIPDLGAGINIRTTEAGASFPFADVPALVEAIWAKAQQAGHFHDQLPCPHPRCGPCTADARLAESEREGEIARLTAGPRGVLAEIHMERQAQDAKWGEQNHADGTGLPIYQSSARRYRDQAQRAAEAGHLKWRDVLQEEVYEALAEADPAKLRGELVQVAAVAAAWIEAIDRRTGAATGATDAVSMPQRVHDGPLVDYMPAELLVEAADAIAAEAERGPKSGLTRIYLRGYAARLREVAGGRLAYEQEQARERWDAVPYAVAGEQPTPDHIAAVQEATVLFNYQLEPGKPITATLVNQALTQLRQAARTAPEGWQS